MPDSHAEPSGAATDAAAATSSATATAEPPRPPASPPKTGVAAPSPGRGRGCLLAGLLAAVVLGLALGGFVWWAVAHSGGTTAPSTQDVAGAFASAMKKAGVHAPAAPAGPVDLIGVKAVGAHPFDATFSDAELTALLRSFAFTPTSGTRLALAVDSVSLESGGNLRLSGKVTASGTTYRGWVQGPAQFVGGKIEPTGTYSANAEGLDVSPGQASQAASVLIDDLNGYLAAAPGLKVDSAAITATGVHVTGTAPDSISW